MTEAMSMGGGPQGLVPSVGSDWATPAFLESLRREADAEADDVIRSFVENELGVSAHGTLRDALIAYRPGGQTESVLAEFVASPIELPDWADMRGATGDNDGPGSAGLFRRGQDLFAEYVPQFGLALWMGSIPAGYAGRRDVIVLHRTQELVSHPKRRFLETGQYILDVMTPGCLEPGANGRSSIRHVRLMHGAVRYMLTEEADELEVPDWDSASGVPINQEALLATLLTFSVVGIQSIEKFGVGLSDQDRDAYCHTWSVIGYLMGIRGDLLPLNYADSAEIWERIKAKEYGPCDEGQDLTAHALEVMARLIPGRFADGVAASGIRFLLGKQTADLLGVPGSNWTTLLFVPLRFFGHVARAFGRSSWLARKISERLGRKIFQTFIDLEWDPERSPSDRGGVVGRHARPRFSVPRQLRRRLRIKG